MKTSKKLQKSMTFGLYKPFYHVLVLFMIALAFSSCSSDDDSSATPDDGSDPDPKVLKITSAITNADFSARHGHSTAVFDNKLWVIGGNDGSSRLNDVWSSADGNNWTQEIESADFLNKYGQASAVFDNKLWVIGGYNGTLFNDVWYLDYQ